jgi:hypothetical protein
MVEALEERQLLSSYFVNFTSGPNASASASNPPEDVPGYMTDIGSAYGDRADRGNPGMSYGWIDYTTGAPKNNEVNGRNRNDATSPNELLDSFNHMMKPDDNTPSGWANWEIAIPNGTYAVKLASGDITATNSHFIINVEGVKIEDGIPTGANAASHFVTGSGVVTVTDGKLTVSTAAGASNNKINYIEINQDPPSGVITDLHAAGTGGKVQLLWTPASGASSYDIYRGSTSGGETLLQAGFTGTNFTDSTVQVGNTYYYYVIPKNVFGPGAQSNESGTLVSATYVHVNFQPSTATVPTGYLPDSGDAYGDRGNTFSYGWWNAPAATGVAVPTANGATRERNNVLSPDKRYDTFDHLHKDGQSPPNGPVWWEIAVPNGTYQVRVVGGESDNVDEFISFVAEANKDANGVPQVDGSGVTLIHQDMTGSAGLGHWTDSGTIAVTVTDGTLTISEGPDASNNKITFIDIDTLNVATTPVAPTSLSISNVRASQLTLNWTDNSTNETGFRIEQSTDGGTTFTALATAPAHTGTGTVSYVIPGLTPQSHYYYRVYALNLQGDSATPTNTADATTLAATASVTGRMEPSTGDVNLATEGTLDWAHWAYIDANSFDHKANLISDVVPVGSTTRMQITNSPTTFTWSGGTPDSDAFSTNTGLGTFAFGHGYTFTVPADTTTRVLRVYTGVQNVRGQLTARLSDGSAADYVDSSLFNANVTDGVYTIVYKAASGGQTLSVTWLEIPPNGDQVDGRLSLKAATLQVPQATVGTATNVVATPLASGRVFLTWQDQSTNSIGYLIERAPDNGGQPGTWTQIAQVNNPTTSYLDQGTLGVASTKYYYRLTPINIALATGTASTVVSATTPATLGDGAQATYYTFSSAPPQAKDFDFGTPWPTTSIDPTIDFNWAAGAPAGAGAGFQTDNFVVRWTAKIKPEFTGEYTFFADADDGYRLIVNGQKLLDSLDRRGGLGNITAGTPITLQAGQSYDLIFDQVEQGGNAGARLYWSTANLPREIIPQASLFHEAPDNTPPKVLGLVMDGKLPAGVPFSPSQHLLIQFSENVGGTLIGDYITLIGDEGSVFTAGTLDVAWDAASSTAIVTFPGAPSGTIPDTNYQVFINGQVVTDGSGNMLDGNGDGTGGDDFTGRTFAFTADANHDRTVDFNDLVKLAQNYNSTGGKSFEEGDFNHDGNVDFNDLVLLAQRYNTSLAPPAAAQPVQAPPAAAASKPAPAPKLVAKSTPVKTAPVKAKEPAKVTKPVVTSKSLSPSKLPPESASAAPKSTFATKRSRDLNDWLGNR